MCGKQLPVPVVASGDRVRVLFHSNEAVQGDGFQVIVIGLPLSVYKVFMLITQCIADI